MGIKSEGVHTNFAAEGRREATDGEEGRTGSGAESSSRRRIGRKGQV